MTASPVVSPPFEGRVKARARVRLDIRGCVQGVGFRPFVWNLARELGLSGWINNSPQGVTIEIEGDPRALFTFQQELPTRKPALAQILGLTACELDPAGDTDFQIRTSQTLGRPTTLVLPDIATCDACLEELWNPQDRRYRYPFVNCTHCGPRFSIITALPYDRPNTTMAGFPLCEECRREYENPQDRRFHAQPVACPRCGPYLSLLDSRGRTLCERDAAVLAAAEYLRSGRILAVKGLGGFHLWVRAGDEAAVARLRSRKHREAKPLAVMFPDLDSIRKVCEVRPAEEQELKSPAAPIVLLDRRADSEYDVVAKGVAPGFRTLGVMLPYTPMHHLLMQALRVPVVATSGNRSDEPICTDETEALSRLADIADLFLVHNRPIARHVDDSVVRVVQGQPMVLRRGRGFTPSVVGEIESEAPAILAVGADLKNCAAQSYSGYLLPGQHVGDLEHPLAFVAFQKASQDLKLLLKSSPAKIACDLHPDHHSTRWALGQGLPVRQIQHHHAHVVSCMVDNDLHGSVLGVSWDGTGYGPDGTIWGGEFLKADLAGFRRFAHLRTFPLPGGDRSARDGRLCALGLLYELHGVHVWEAMPEELAAAFTTEARRVLLGALMRGVHTHRTSSAGRWFDGVAALLGVGFQSRFEGEAACALETCAAQARPGAVPAPAILSLHPGPLAVDWGPLVENLLQDRARGVPACDLAWRLHAALAQAIVSVAALAGEERVVLTGGCFQNRLLHELTTAALEPAGFKVYRHHRVPPNDGGLAVGQLAAAWAQEKLERV